MYRSMMGLMLTAAMAWAAGPPALMPASDHAIAWKGSALLRQQQRRLFLRLAGDSESKVAAEALQAATRRLAALRLSLGATKDKLGELEKEREEAEKLLKELSALLPKMVRSSAEDIAKALPDGVVLVDFHFFGWPGFEGKDGKVPWERRLVAYTHRNGKPASRVESKAKPDDIDKAIREWRDLIIARKPDREAAARVKVLVWEPLEKHLDGAKAILLSLDGALNTVSFAALPGKRKGTFLIEDVALAIIPVPSAIPELMKPIPAKGRLNPSLLVVGGVDFGKGKKWAALPTTATEADKVAALFRAAHKVPAVRLSGDKATTANVREALKKARFAHLATHGYFAAEEVKKPRGGGKGKPGGLFEDEGVIGWDPALLSGLVLAGANKPTEDDDGIFMASEVAELDLSALELAVLSGDETALGVQAAGEGMLDLQRAFQVAGCRSVVAALWKIDRDATRVLMERFHHHLWAKKLPKAEALRQAQLDIIRDPTLVDKKAKTAPPAWWAAWQLSGDWR